MTRSNILGLVVLAVGVILLVFAWRGTGAPMDQMTDAMTGRFTGATMWYLVCGVAAVIAGAGLLYRSLARG
ncbi:MAG: DUF3185 family protein [Rhodobacteraceae bacterium]|jgi:hypothetical protein|nr:DUF3185 family protein [Paracoccaceae bacterium]